MPVLVILDMIKLDRTRRYIIAVLLVLIIVISGGYMIKGRISTASTTAVGYVSLCVNSQPNITATNCSETAIADALYHCYINASDRDQQMLTWYDDTDLFNITNTSSNTSLISWTPTINDSGDYTINITVSDGGTCELQDTYWLNITVASFCGDGFCSSDETYLSCPEDCETPFVAPEEPVSWGTGGSPNYFLSPAKVFIKTTEGAEESFSIALTNSLSDKQDVSVSISDSLAEIVTLDKESFSVSAMEKYFVSFDVDAPDEVGVYTGVISFKMNSTIRRATVVIEVESLIRTFEIILELNETTRTQGEYLRSQAKIRFFTLKEDTFLVKYDIQDINSTLVYSENESITVDDEIIIQKRIPTAGLNPGLYFFSVSAVLGDEVASDSDIFTLYARRQVGISDYLIMTATIAGVLLVFWLIVGWRRKTRI